MARWPAILVLFVMIQSVHCLADLPKPIFYVPFEGSRMAAIAGGLPAPRISSQQDPILSLVDMGERRFRPGKVGLCYDADDVPLVYRCHGNFRPDEGSCSFWLSPSFRGDDTNLYCTFFGAADWGMVYKYLKHTTVTFGTAKAEDDLYYDCSGGDISDWRPGQWHHIVLTWSRRDDERRIHVDGEMKGRAPFPFHRDATEGPLFIGSGCTLFPGHVAHARLDEFAIWDRALTAANAHRLFDLGTNGKPLWEVEHRPAAVRGSELALPAPGALEPIEAQPQPSADTPTRSFVSLDGWWHFRPAMGALTPLPETGWGRSRVPGYWTSAGATKLPDGQPARGQWSGQSLSDYDVGCYHRTFHAESAWRGKNVFLHLDGVEGLARVAVNGRELDWLPGWEHEGYDVSDLLEYGGTNSVTIASRPRGQSDTAGVYGSVQLRLLPDTFIQSTAVRPHVEADRLDLYCDLYHRGGARDGAVEFTIRPVDPPQNIVKRFTRPIRLMAQDSTERRLSAQLQKLTFSFDWPGAHIWTIDDPFLYQLQARLRIDSRVVDEAPPVIFGFREFTRRGSEFLLNGQPIHLRGHQVNLRWGNQMQCVRDVKAAGMNCIELAGPIGHNWYSAGKYETQAFEQILSYCDEHGILALPILPDARALKERIFEPDLAQLYRRRLKKHILRYGNHPSVVMWFMHFNLAGYRWYIPPDKIDGSYKPSEEHFATKERYCLQAQRIAQEIDPRPIYHHACGNFGDIYTLNCYIGPTSPLQERSEWPSRWAEKRPFPLLACEHGLFLVPYWYRPRQFPLSVVYSGEPIFDELTAKFMGRRAYQYITPELLDLYSATEDGYRKRLDALIRKHPGYQRVKSLVARESLRAWRTYGVSGIIFNAVNWDFRADDGTSLPVLHALARYFGDCDLYVAGPEGNWPSKDHSFFAGERIQKQIVLINDLGRDISCKLAWRVIDSAGAETASGRLDAVARPGRAGFYPFEFDAPDVQVRTELKIVVDVVNQPGDHFRSESFPLEVFPGARRPAVARQILLYDTAGQTTRMLDARGITFDRLTDSSDLSDSALVIVGRESYDPDFVELARDLHLERAVANGANLLIFEQTDHAPCGLTLHEQSARRVFMAQPDHPFFQGLEAPDLFNLRGASDLMAPYPPASAETRDSWPPRFFKWGNRGIVASYVYYKPHYAPFVPVAECGFDLSDSPLLEARIGAGRVVLCQMDVTRRCGTDPVSTKLVDNLLDDLTRPAHSPVQQLAVIGASNTGLLRKFGIAPSDVDPGNADLIIAGSDTISQADADAIEAAVRGGATLLLCPGASLAARFGLVTSPQRLFIARLKQHSLLASLSDGDLYFKSRETVPCAAESNGWRPLAEPGIIAVKRLGDGTIVSCQLEPDALQTARARVKALRFWSLLLANLHAPRGSFRSFLSPEVLAYEDNECEQIPPYINW